MLRFLRHAFLLVLVVIILLLAPAFGQTNQLSDSLNGVPNPVDVSPVVVTWFRWIFMIISALGSFILSILTQD